MKTIAVIPAFNEATVLSKVVKEVAEYVEVVLVVNDCSSDETASVAKEAGAEVLTHPLQRGAGRATATGIQAALRAGADLIVTLDADGQHLAEEIPVVLEPVKEGRADLVVGCRILQREDMPWLKRAGNRFANLWTWLILGVAVSDSQSGFRAYTRKAAEELPLEARGYEFCSQTLGEAVSLGLRIEEVPITVIYSEYSQAKGQSFMTGVKTLARIAKEGLR